MRSWGKIIRIAYLQVRPIHGRITSSKSHHEVVDMKAKWIAILTGCGILLCAVAPIWAHHSSAVSFETTKRVQLTGSISRIEWTNPHVILYLDVRTSEGKVETWAVEEGGVNGFKAQGF